MAGLPLPSNPLIEEIQRRVEAAERERLALASMLDPDAALTQAARMQTPQGMFKQRPRQGRATAGDTITGAGLPNLTDKETGMRILNAPAAATGAGAGYLLDHPGDTVGALGAGLRAGVAAPTTPLEEQTDIAKELERRDIEIPGGIASKLWLGMAGDPTNWIGGDPSDLFKLGAVGAVGAVKKGAKALRAAVEPNVVAEAAKALFPKVDNYGKPAGLVSAKTILKRVEAATDLAPETRAALTDLAGQVGDRRVQPSELHALAAGETYKPARVLRKPRTLKEGEKQIVGAPLGVANARDTRALRENYIEGMERGAAGRDWYHDTGRDILFAANDDPERALLFTGDLSITSPTSSVGANTGFGIKGYNQATAGVPVVAGRYPTRMGESIETLHAGGEGSLGLKRDPFLQNIALGGGFHPDQTRQLSEGVDLIIPGKKARAVHDIWDAELHGYVNPDGTPMRTGFGPAQHRFMDTQQDKLLATANKRATAGHTNWDELRSQAAAWTGGKISAEMIDPTDAAKHFGDYFEPHYAQGSREATPGASTGHMPELLEPENGPLRQLWHEIVKRESGIYDQQMRDQISAGFGGLQGRAFEGPGYWKGQITPGMQTRVLTGSLDVPGGLPGARMVDEGSRRIMDASEAVYALGMGQEGAAWSRLMPTGSGGARSAWDITLPGGTITPDQLQELLRRLGPGADSIIPISTPTGIRLSYGPQDLSVPQQALPFMRDMEPRLKSAVKAIGGKVEEAGAIPPTLQEFDWKSGPPVGDVMGQVQKLKTGPQDFDKFAPQIFGKLRDLNPQFVREVGGRVTLAPVMDEVLGTVANEGWAGLERLAKKYAIPTATLAAALAVIQEAQQQAPVQGQG